MSRLITCLGKSLEKVLNFESINLYQPVINSYVIDIEATWQQSQWRIQLSVSGGDNLHDPLRLYAIFFNVIDNFSLNQRLKRERYFTSLCSEHMGSIIGNGLTTGLSILQGESGPEGDKGEPGPPGPEASNLKFCYLYSQVYKHCASMRSCCLFLLLRVPIIKPQEISAGVSLRCKVNCCVCISWFIQLKSDWSLVVILKSPWIQN